MCTSWCCCFFFLQFCLFGSSLFWLFIFVSLDVMFVSFTHIKHNLVSSLQNRNFDKRFHHTIYYVDKKKPLNWRRIGLCYASRQTFVGVVNKWCLPCTCAFAAIGKLFVFFIHKPHVYTFNSSNNKKLNQINSVEHMTSVSLCSAINRSCHNSV